MPWRNRPGGGFTEPGVRPWLPLGDLGATNVEDQRGDAGSVLHLAHDLIALRRASADLHAGAYRSLPAAAGTWAWSRGERMVVAVSMTDGSGVVEGVTGRVLIGSDRTRDGAEVIGTLHLGPWEAVVVERSG